MKIQVAVSAAGLIAVTGVVAGVALAGGSHSAPAKARTVDQPVVVVTTTAPAKPAAVKAKPAVKHAKRAVVSHSVKRHAVSHTVVVRRAAVTDPTPAADPTTAASVEPGPAASVDTGTPEPVAPGAPPPIKSHPGTGPQCVSGNSVNGYSTDCPPQP